MGQPCGSRDVGACFSESTGAVDVATGEGGRDPCSDATKTASQWQLPYTDGIAPPLEHKSGNMGKVWYETSLRCEMGAMSLYAPDREPSDSEKSWNVGLGTFRYEEKS